MGIVVTTESPEVMKEVRAFTSRTNEAATLLWNRHDVLQGTGFLEARDYPSTNATADQAMLSAMASLKLQLATRITIGNCCSNFHLLLADLLSEGCGLSPHNTFQCLQDHKDPNVRPCCSWDTSPICLARRNNATLSL